MIFNALWSGNVETCFYCDERTLLTLSQSINDQKLKQGYCETISHVDGEKFVRATTRRSIFNALLWTGCPLGKWGRNCEMDCECQNGATCDPFNGDCMCTRGWIGTYCDQKCSPDRYGQDCAEICRCKNGGSCHHISGECHCASGYTGPLWVFK